MLAHLSSWISDSRSSDKLLNGQLDGKMANATRPVVEILPGGGMGKRKRSVSVEVPEIESQATYEAKRRKILPVKGDVSQPVRPTVESEPNVKSKAVVDSSRLRDAIESQFSLEILLKHKELRLINQELAKCQVALEQLRRCHLVPYPATQLTPESMLNITNGRGPAIGHSGNVPRWAPSFGITDGPYTRHYSKWLIPDPSFDGIQPEWQVDGSRAGKTVPEGRSTRYGIADGIASFTKSRSQRGSQGQKLQALSSGYPQEKTKVGPCVLKRPDGQTVKLVCIDCNRWDFSSTQGFINHCRIAHRREFKSHEEAAVISGQPYEVDESHNSAPDASVPVPTPTAAPIIATGLVHPLIKATPADPEAYRNLLARIDTGLVMFRQGKLPGVNSIPTSAEPTPIKPKTLSFDTPSTANIIPSSDTPKLSDWLRSKGFVGDLSRLVGEAKTKVDLDDISSQDGDSESETSTPVSRFGLNGPEIPLPVMRVPARATMSPAPNRPGSSKGMDLTNGRPGSKGISPRLTHATPAINTSSPHFHRPARVFTEIRGHDGNDQLESDLDLEMMDGPSVTELSPNTISSNNAPSLVSDDGEYEDGDDADSATSDNEEEDSVAEIDIADDGIEKVVPRTVLRNRASSGSGRGMDMRKEDKHVTFMSPVKDSSKERRRK